MTWKNTNNKLTKTFKFDSYDEVLKFVECVGLLAQECDHHPEVKFDISSVSVSIWSHDTSSVTSRDEEIAAKIDQLFESKRFLNKRFVVVPACFMIFRKEDRVLLFERQNTPWFNGWYDLPAGHIESGEFPLEAAIREAKEEVGITAINPRFVGSFYRMYDGENTRADFFFECSEWEGEVINGEPAKHGEPQWFSIDELPEKTLEHTRRVIMGESNLDKYYEKE